MSIQDDIFDLGAGVEEGRIPKEYASAIERLIDWGTDNENENERIRPIVGHMKEAIELMFKDHNNGK